MVDLHPQILTKDGKEEFVVLPYDEFLRIQDELDDFEDFRQLRQAREDEGSAPTLSLAEVKRGLADGK